MRGGGGRQECQLTWSPNQIFADPSLLQVSLRLEGPPVWPVWDVPWLCLWKLQRALAVCVRRQLGRTAVWQRSDTYRCYLSVKKTKSLKSYVSVYLFNRTSEMFNRLNLKTHKLHQISIAIVFLALSIDHGCEWKSEWQSLLWLAGAPAKEDEMLVDESLN